MHYTSTYQSVLGKILLACDDTGLTGLWFEGQKYYANGLNPEHEEKEHPIFKEVKQWLNLYFSGKEPGFMPPIHMTGTSFGIEVWNILLDIPYGMTTTYGEIASTVAQKRGLSGMSAQAVGSAVGHNRISIIIPCHRVVGKNGSLTGYAGGINKKLRLLMTEGIDTASLFVPLKGTAL